jgi:hypothetical protein
MCGSTKVCLGLCLTCQIHSALTCVGVFDVVVKCVYCRLAFFTSVMAVFLMGQALRVMVDYWLSIWVDRKYQLSTRIYVISYACFVGAAITFSLGRALMFTKAALWSARKMHSLMAERVLRSPQLFFDQNPVGRILNRFGKDQAMVDELLPYTAQVMYYEKRLLPKLFNSL